MKVVRIIFLSVFMIMVILPAVLMNTEIGAISEINNSVLPDITISDGIDTSQIDDYLSNRIGFYDEAVTANIYLNDKLFGEMEHPTYTYGKDGYVFFKMNNNNVDVNFISAFCAYLKKMQDYCEDRNVPFIYCINPSKSSVYTEYLPEGYNYSNKFLDELYKQLELNNINYISNVELLREKAQTEQVYNIKYDAGHWNDLGEFYGTNNLLKKVGEYYSDVSENTLDMFNVETIVEKSLPVSKFTINEEVPKITCKSHENIQNLAEHYRGLKINENHSAFAYIKNTGVNDESDIPRVAFFHGSYYNRNRHFYDCVFKETYAIHNYQNIMDLDYYFNIFQPECVILETAEYATGRSYFDIQKLNNKTLNPTLDTVIGNSHEEVLLSELDYNTEENGNLNTITFESNVNYKYGYVNINNIVYDLNISGKTISCTIDKTRAINFDNSIVYLFE